ncbi:hypothetical protein N7526_006203 [Penicillium atrosanguineum]|nr:hypothetical protein N7526_006203 [Penicillium atrosanguineum]
MIGRTPLSYDDYTVGWICALPLEMAAAKLMLDAIHPSLPRPGTDHNTYIFGSIGKHNIVIACLPSGAYSNISAATVAMQLLSSFHSIQFGLMVGIGGGVPSSNVDIRLGDIVVSQPADISGGVIQYDLGKALSGSQFQRTGMLNRPPKVLLTALATLQAHHFTEDSRVPEFLVEIQAKTTPRKAANFARPTQEDCLYQADYDHTASNMCVNCDRAKLYPRPSRDHEDSVIHYGLIASANQVVKDGRRRDQLAKDLEVYCVEMEAAGLMNDFPCLVIRGICDYADSHKNKEWQGYAAAVAAAYAKELLLVVPIDQIDNTPRARDTVADSVGTLEPSLTELENQYHSGRALYAQDRYKEAETMFRQGLQGREKVLGHDHTDTFYAAHWLGRSLYKQDRYKEAETMLRRALQGREKVLSYDHKDTLNSAYNLGRSLYGQDRYQEAETMFRRALQGWEEVLGYDHTDTLYAAHWLGRLLYTQGRYKEAESMFRRAFQGREKVLGHGHKDTLNSAYNLGRSLYAQDRYKEAETMLQRAFQGWEKVLGCDHIDTLYAAHWLGRLFYTQGRYKEAETMFRRAFQGREKRCYHNNLEQVFTYEKPI